MLGGKSVGKVNFSSDNLLNLKFTKNVKGYDAYQVDVSLDKVLEDYRFYENFYTEAKQYIAKLESEITKLRNENREKDVELAKVNKRIDGIEDDAKVSSGNLALLQRISALEKVLYSKGIDPSRIR